MEKTAFKKLLKQIDWDMNRWRNTKRFSVERESSKSYWKGYITALEGTGQITGNQYNRLFDFVWEYYDMDSERKKQYFNIKLRVPTHKFKRRGRKGWHGESRRHALARKGIKTRR